MASLLRSATLLAAVLGCHAASLVHPSWDFKSGSATATCVDATDAAHPNNQRWVYSALPAGTAPAKGWPVWFSFVTDVFPGPVGAPPCGGGGGGSPYHHDPKNFSAFGTPFEAGEFCYKNATNATAAATAADRGGFPPHHHRDCDYDQQAGAIWDQRLKQVLLANGVAVLQVNPIQQDDWEYGELPWAQGNDTAFLAKTFGMLAAGAFGALDPRRVVLRGWSGGAQMVSWMYETIARNGTFPQIAVVGGVMLSGGSYDCYNDPGSDAGPSHTPVASCASCTPGGPSHCADDPLCSSCNTTVKTYCQQCCPRNYTERWFAETPGAYASHPPTLLAQMSTTDNHADLCACKNYHDTLVAHGVKSELVLVPEADEPCFCIGNPDEPAAAGSPFAHKCREPGWGQNCTTMGGKDCCIAHTLGFAKMIEPAVNFCLDLFAAASDA